MRGLREYLKDFISKRSDDISSEICCSHEKYIGLSLRSSALQKKLRHKLPQEMLDLLAELETLETSQQAIMQDKLYKQGLQDGIRIARTIEQLGRKTSCR